MNMAVTNSCSYDMLYAQTLRVYIYNHTICITRWYFAYTLYIVLTSPHMLVYLASSDSIVGAGVGAFIGGVLLTAAIGGGIAIAVLYKAKRRSSIKTEYE